jgi:hypothetical protein
VNEEVGERALSKNPAIGHAVQGDPARHAERFHLGFLLKMVHKTYAYNKRLQPARILPDIEYFDCELPRVRRMMEDPEDFLDGLRGRRIVLDEIHRLPNPSEMLKIAADHYPRTRVIATGSSPTPPACSLIDPVRMFNVEHGGAVSFSASR